MASRDAETPTPLARLSAEDIARIRESTVGHYERAAEAFWRGTKDHDVSQNVDAFLRHLPKRAPLAILDLGCGPGRDLLSFRRLGHEPVGLDGAPRFVEMARAHAGCEVMLQDLLALDLPVEGFDGVFANAVLFHVPTQELPRVLREIRASLVPGGVLFASNPRGPDIEEQHGARYGAYLRLETWRAYVGAAGFEELEHYYRPPNRPRSEQPWLATVWRRS